MARAPTPTSGARRLGQIDIHARAEADQAEALAGATLSPSRDEANDAPRDEPGDLDDAEAPVAPYR